MNCYRTFRLSIFASALIALAGAFIPAYAHDPVVRARTPVQLPEVPGYVTLKCDFHIHTVFSDGLVWPSVRSEEAWRQGLDAIAITDHLEYQPHKADVTTNHNRSYEIAQSAGNELDVMVVKGSEITRNMPPGHLNAIFLTDSTPLATTAWRDAVRAAHQQGAFIFWNHPGWERQLKDGRTVWYPEHTELLTNGMLHGIEVVNGRDYYPEAHRWAIEHHLAMLSNSDIHDPMNLELGEGEHRPITLVFAKARTPGALKEALFARQTAVYSGNLLVGDEKFMRPLVTSAIQVKTPALTLRNKQRKLVQLHNASDVEFTLKRAGELKEISFPSEVILPPRKTVLVPVTATSAGKGVAQRTQLPYKVSNVLTGPDQPLGITLDLEIDFIADQGK